MAYLGRHRTAGVAHPSDSTFPVSKAMTMFEKYIRIADPIEAVCVTYDNREKLGWMIQLGYPGVKVWPKIGSWVVSRNGRYEIYDDVLFHETFTKKNKQKEVGS